MGRPSRDWTETLGALLVPAGAAAGCALIAPLLTLPGAFLGAFLGPGAVLGFPFAFLGAVLARCVLAPEGLSSSRATAWCASSFFAAGWIARTFGGAGDPGLGTLALAGLVAGSGPALGLARNLSGGAVAVFAPALLLPAAMLFGGGLFPSGGG